MSFNKKNIVALILFAIALLIVFTPSVFAIDYNNICADEGIGKVMKIIGYVLLAARWIVPLIIIVLGMMDFGKAVLSSDDKAISKAAGSLVKRIIAGVIVFFVPTIIFASLDLIKVTGGLENSRFGSCTECLKNPGNC